MKSILVAYDHSDSAQRALDRAAQLAEAFGSKVIVTSVAPLLVGTPRSVGPVDPTDSPAEHERELHDAQAFLRERGVDPTLAPAIGDPAGAIAKLAEAHDVDLVVVGTREPGLAERILRHSVSSEVARRVRRDLLIVHPAH